MLAKKCRVAEETLSHAKTDDASILQKYCANSQRRLAPLVKRAAEKLLGIRYQIYGAGSHSARLYPMLKNMGIDGCVAFFDRNENLVGSHMGGLPILHPSMIDHNIPVLLSSFLSEDAIAKSLSPDIEAIYFYSS